jgi:hypothetical protein
MIATPVWAWRGESADVRLPRASTPRDVPALKKRRQAHLRSAISSDHWQEFTENPVALLLALLADVKNTVCAPVVDMLLSV